MSTDQQALIRRLLFLESFAICAAAMGYALYLEHYEYLDPCPLCMMQRFAMIGVGIFALLGASHGRAAGWWANFMSICAIAGIGLAANHIRIQNLPPEEVPACGAGFDSMLDTLGLGETLIRSLKGSGDCATVDWAFMGQSMPVWVLVLFVVLLGNAITAGIVFNRKVKAAK